VPIVTRETSEKYERQADPGRLRARTTGCVKWRLSDAGGLTPIGAGGAELAPDDPKKPETSLKAGYRVRSET